MATKLEGYIEVQKELTQRYCDAMLPIIEKFSQPPKWDDKVIKALREFEKEFNKAKGS
jgi:hypothetical protein